jgi:hypothetical protein
MNYVRKMMLVPEGEMLQKIQLAEQPVTSKAGVQTEQAMQTLLSAGSISDDVRVKLYNELLQRLQDLTQPTPPPLPIAPTALPPPAAPPSPRPEGAGSDVDWIVGQLPASYRDRAQKLLRSVPAAWDENNRLVISGRPVPNSNIVDLLRFAVRPQGVRATQQPPAGWNQMQLRIKARKVPRSIVPTLATTATAINTRSNRRWLTYPAG